MRELFIYWRTAADNAAAAQRAAQAWQQQLRTELPGLRAKLFRRADEVGPAVTMMEVYAMEIAAAADVPQPAASLNAAVASRISREGDDVLGRWIQGQRKVEVFVAVGEC